MYQVWSKVPSGNTFSELVSIGSPLTTNGSPQYLDHLSVKSYFDEIHCTAYFNNQFLRYCYNITIFCVLVKERSMLKHKITIRNTIMIIDYTNLLKTTIANTSLCDYCEWMFNSLQILSFKNFEHYRVRLGSHYFYPLFISRCINQLSKVERMKLY